MVAGSPNTSVNTNKSRENSLATKIARLDKKVNSATGFYMPGKYLPKES